MNNQDLLMKPILFNTEMVKAIFDGRKMQTRRIVKGSHEEWIMQRQAFIDNFAKYKVGDVLYIRETFGEFTHTRFDGTHTKIIYKADRDLEYRGVNPSNSGEFFHGWKPSIHMPKDYARIFLKVTDVMVEKLHDISHSDCLSEGVIQFGKEAYIDYENRGFATLTAIDSFSTLWNVTAQKGYKWNDNPYVFVYEFKRIKL